LWYVAPRGSLQALPHSPDNALSNVGIVAQPLALVESTNSVRWPAHCARATAPLTQYLEGRLDFCKGKDAVHHGLDAFLGYQFYGFLWAQRLGGPAQIADEYGLTARPRSSGWGTASHGVEAGAGERLRIRHGLFKTLGKGLFPAWQSTKATLTSVPIAWGKVGEHLCETTRLQTRGERLGGDAVRKGCLNATEACTSSGVIAGQQIDFLKQKTEIGGELWPSGISVRMACARGAQHGRSTRTTTLVTCAGCSFWR
jgi:hypothetical protein